MVVAGLLVNTAADMVEQVKSALLRIAGVEINTVLDENKIVIIIESKRIEDEVLISKKIADIEGVLGINIAYHHFGDDEIG